MGGWHCFHQVVLLEDDDCKDDYADGDVGASS